MKPMPVPASTFPVPTASAPDSRLLALTDQCVMCGLCLPHCPTYRVEAIEAESPRGRIAMARALTLGTLAPTSTTLLHLDQCLGCLSCQKVCPSLVQYEEILVGTRAALAATRPVAPRGIGTSFRRVLRDPLRLTALARIGSALQAGRWLPLLGRVLPQGSIWRRLALTQTAVPHPERWPRMRPSTQSRGRVALFRGCVASVYDRDTFAAGRYLVEALGYQVVETESTHCCGALPRHAGDLVSAQVEATHTRDALQATGATVVLVSATGCFGDMQGQVLPGGTPRVVDIHAFLAGDAGLATLRFKPLAKRAALHLPCTQVNVVGELDAIRTLLARIPELSVLTLPEQPRCCGAAGSYFIEHPAIADRLRDEKLDQMGTLAPDLLLTTNIGCRLHLGVGLRQRDAAVPVLHPLALLAQQLDNPFP
ncbi:MAG: (Fe-S)-binding protein [Dokdonella sp.]